MRNTDKKYTEWKSRVHVRDDFICQECGSGGNHAHHIKSWVEFPNLRYEVSNGITLCLNCHMKKNKGKKGTGILKKGVFFRLQFVTYEKLKMESLRTSKPMNIILDNLVENIKD